METVLILLLLLFLYLVIRNYRKCEGFSDICSSKNLVTFYKNINKIDGLTPKKKEDMLLKILKSCRYEDDMDAFKEWAESGVGRMEISDYHDLMPNNRKCMYEVGLHGGHYVEVNREDLDNYYDAPIQNNPDIDPKHLGDPQKLKIMLDIYNSSMKNYHKLDLEDYFTYSDENKFDKDALQLVRDDLDDARDKYLTGIGVIDKKYHRCDTPYARKNDSFRVNRPDIRLDEKLKSQNSTIPIPCSKPLLPWLVDPGDEDENNRKYCKPQTKPCEKCGKFSDTPIYGYRYDKAIDGELFNGPFDGPNRTPQDVNTESLRYDEYYGDDGFVKDLQLFGGKQGAKP